MKISYQHINRQNFTSKIDKKENQAKTTHGSKLNYPTSEQLQGYTPCGRINLEKIIMDKNKEKYIAIRDGFCEKLEPKYLDAAIKDWNFYTNSTKENMEKSSKANDEIQELYRNEQIYNELAILQKQDLGDKHLNNQIKHFYKDFDEELNAGETKKALRDKENEIAAKYNSYVPKIDGKEVSKAEISKIMQMEKDPQIRQKAYDAKVKGGDLIANDLVEFVKMRNEFAKSQGYDNFFDYQLKETYDVEPKELNKLLDDVFEKAKESNKQIQTEEKKDLAKAFNIQPNKLEAYHYGLLSDEDPTREVNKSLKNKEQVVDISKQAYKNMGYDIDNMPITLDLFPRKNKNTHGFCFDIDAGKDARILANLTNDAGSIDTLCHELGHCVYHLGINPNLPFLEKTASSPAMTEAVAMMMGDLMKTENILEGIVDDKTLNKFKDTHKKDESKFINHSMLIINFEREMYKNPDQNLGKLWHDLKCQYKGRNQSEKIDNEWATIPHYLSHPAYYQNYFRADLMKAQIYEHLTNKLGLLTENPNTAEYLNKNIFECGKSIEENDLIEQLTGKKLSSDALCKSLQVDNN